MAKIALMEIDEDEGIERRMERKNHNYDCSELFN
jgi:hypothetical protein